MSSILKKLQYLEFPECTKEALNYIVRNYASDPHRGVPGRAGASENIAVEVAQEYIIDMSRRKGHKHRKLNAVHELQLLEMLCSALQEAPEHACYSIFSAIFGGHVDPFKINLMTQLVSMAISVSCGPVLGCAAIWMQEQGSQSQSVCDLAQKLVDDYCMLYPNVSKAFKNLPKVSSLFTCNFMTALTTIYPYTDASKSPPPVLLECIVDWISSDSCLCSDSVRLVRIQSTFTCPIGGLVRWCILGPLVTASSGSDKNASGHSKMEQSSALKAVTFTDEKLQSLFPRLHLAVLQSLQAYKSMELQEHLLTFTDLFIVSKTLAVFYKGGQCSEQLLPVVNTSTDRLAQIIQVALTTNSLPGKFDIRQVCEGLPQNRLMQMILTMRYGKQEPMDLS
ncbi:integrator complex subunit 15-like [Mercenaria mercenaria]|uniref:integrator complex subunit 15-like n=1 Tax=Mercenaria mercenaria TaxID=6596 RepID=UPI00234F5D0C|nr:integrator complex subunit 15-like [Mercenaria mercenaria]XP_045214165.2 integrator complex subunit 15-like [Mercenaria mercenaria]